MQTDLPHPGILLITFAAAVRGATRFDVRVRIRKLSGPRTIPAPAWVLTGIISVQVGNAWAHTLFERVGAGGAGLVRLAWATVILMLLYRPRLRGRSRQEWLPAVALGLVLAGMNLTFYHAIARLPLGIAVTIEFIGPMAVAVAHSHRRRDLVWVLLAAAGIISLAHGNGHDLNVLGMVFAAVAGAFWGTYILLQARLGQAFSDGSGLGLAMLAATLVALPDGLFEGGPALLHSGVLGIGIAVGLLSSVIPYSLELMVLRRMSPGVFGVLMSLEPAAAAIAGVLILSQGLSPRELVGIALVSAASLGTSLFGERQIAGTTAALPGAATVVGAPPVPGAATGGEALREGPHLGL